MRVMLIQPPVSYPGEASMAKHRLPVLPPLGLMYVAASIEVDGGHTVSITDGFAEDFRPKHQPADEYHPEPYMRYGLSDKALEAKIRRMRPDVVGVSKMFTNLTNDATNVFRITKKVDNTIITVAGGPHYTMSWKKDMENQDINFGIIQEGEIAMLRLLDYFGNDSEVEGIPGLIYRHYGTARLSAPPEFIKDLDSLPFPAHHLVPPPSYYSAIGSGHGSHSTPGDVSATIIASRGCPFKCRFCTTPILMGQGMRYRSPKNFCDEVEFLRDAYGVTSLSIEDDDFNAVQSKFLGILKEMVRRDLGVTWSPPNGMLAAGINEEAADLMVQTGCNSVSLALESGNKRVLQEIMRKPVSLSHIPKAVKWLRDRGIRVMLFLIVGSPGETKAEVMDTWNFAKKCNADWYGVHIFIPLPGTELWGECIEKGYMPKDQDLSQLKFSVANITTPWIEPAWLEDMARKINLDLNFMDNTNLREGKYEAAKRDFERVLGLYPDLQHAKDALARAVMEGGLY
ncbi:MAG: radical SAM family Fe-S protein [Candidatus Gottesmanbacteria bacterium GW2011_GWB1_49_7]|uniref:Radical SAM family Fe-S protein n=1 Tax=Candidatus Gottesmanbacteria bacterium GW2011_GWB1_49_7 TaxID=1618448 RepID=A0A0G1W212_9BACT|nr:MAG: radical SAM family Fe-S protein [Candidatus Gottesmanbacteria bacterium GW2011_GWB1_49_7]